MAVRKKKICFVTAADISVRAFLLQHIIELSNCYEITVVTKTDDLKFLAKENINASVININFSRKINFINDVICFVKLFFVFLRFRFDAVHSVTPKAGLLAMLASSVLLVPVRIHTYTGQVWVLSSGIKRIFLKSIDKLTGLLSTHSIIDSPSQRDFLFDENIISKDKAVVFGSGSIAGVNLQKFKKSISQVCFVKNELGLPDDAFVFMYLGRLVRDKGILDLAEAFNQISLKNAFLVFVGPDEGGYSERVKVINSFKSEYLRFIGFTNEPSKYLACANVLCLPSYREGFGSVIIEAAAMGIPAIASNIYGVTDAVVNFTTGILHEPGDVNGIRNAMTLLQGDPIYLAKLGGEACSRVGREFDSKKITAEWVKFYKHVIAT